MKFQKVSIAIARIKGLDKEPYYFEHRCFWAFDIIFDNKSSVDLDSLICIKAGDTEEEGKIFCNNLRNTFEKSGIFNDANVAILYASNGRPIAIGCIGRDSWIDVRDNFARKTFKKLDIAITSLKVKVY